MSAAPTLSSLNLPLAPRALQFAPLPRSPEDTGLPRVFLLELIAKHIYSGGDADLRQLTQLTALSWQTLEILIAQLRDNTFVEVRRGVEQELRYALTDKGRNFAIEALARNAYVGPAPISLAHYVTVVKRQATKDLSIDPASVNAAYHDAVVSESLLQQIGPAVLSGRPLIFYGEPGTGKTFLAQRLQRLLGGEIFIPYALWVNNAIIKVFDASVHEAVPSSTHNNSLVQLAQHDTRLVRCKRPAIIVGGELTLEMLDLAYDPRSNVYQAPAHLKANNGVFVIDDLGRQRVRPTELLNRWIIPMEERRDFMTLGSGGRFEVPLEFLMVFSTNLNPRDLADDAFLRRIGYKIKISHLNRDEFHTLWHRVCASQGVTCNEELFEFLMDELYQPSSVPLTACHARDLVGLVMDQCRFNGEPAALTQKRLRHAWNNYFLT